MELWTDVTFGTAGWSLRHGARIHQTARPFGGLGLRPPDQILGDFGYDFAYRLCSARTCLFAMELDFGRAILAAAQPASDLPDIFLRRVGGRAGGARSRSAYQRRPACPALVDVARRGGRELRRLGRS